MADIRVDIMEFTGKVLKNIKTDDYQAKLIFEDGSHLIIFNNIYGDIVIDQENEDEDE